MQGGSENPNGGSTSQGTSTGSSTGGSLIGSSNGSNTSRFASGSVGDSGANVSAATETTTTPSAGDSGAAYEVTKASSEGVDNTPWGTYAVVGVLSVLVLAGVGFFFKGNMFGK